MVGIATGATLVIDGGVGSGKRVPYRPTVLVMMFDNHEQLAEYRRLVNDEGGTT